MYQPESSGMFLFLLSAIIAIIPFWFIFSKAGFSKWLSLLMIIPLVNVIALYYLAFAKWPSSKDDFR